MRNLILCMTLVIWTAITIYQMNFKKQLPIDKQKSQSFSLLHPNIRSISNKFDCFKQFLDALDIHFQIIGLTETWLNDKS